MNMKAIYSHIQIMLRQEMRLQDMKDIAQSTV